jgi:shikimate dehydrogenase
VLSPAAALLQCINCITFDDGVAEGHNTDVPGLERALRGQRLTKLRNRPAIILGAGGAARASVAALAALGFSELHVVNRSAARRRTFRAFAERYGTPVELHAWSAIARLARDAGLVINATSAQVKHEPLALPILGKHAVVYDLTYGDTPLMRAGVARYDGSEMLLHQAAAAFELWTKKRAPVEAMRRALFG